MVEKLIVVGDPIQDEWRLCSMTEKGDQSFQLGLKQTIRRRGGASNTYRNAEAIARAIKLDVVMATPRTGAPTLTRYVTDSTLELIFSTWDVLDSALTEANQADRALWKWYDHNDNRGWKWTVKRVVDPESTPEYPPTALILSDYNKGTLNKMASGPIGPYKGPSNIKFIVVDSKHRSLDPSWLTSYPDAVKVWRCTGNEYDPEWAKQFDWIVWTDGDAPVKIFTSEYMWKKEQGPSDTWVTTIEVPVIETIDVCGAGDTFTAALAVFLCNQWGPSVRENLARGSEFAIKCAQNVCGVRFTAVTDLHL